MVEDNVCIVVCNIGLSWLFVSGLILFVIVMGVCSVVIICRGVVIIVNIIMICC